MKKYVTFIGTLIVSIVLVSCSSAKIENTAPASSKVKKIKYNEDRYIDAYNSRDYKTCLGMLSYKTKRKANIRDNLDIAMLNFLLGDYETASACFETIDEQMFEAVTKSITKTFAAAVGNENAKEYSGNVYESLLVNTMNSLCYYKMGDLTNAINQLSRLSDVKLPEYRRLYGEVKVGEMDPSADSGLKDSKKTLNSYNIDSSVFTNSGPKKPGLQDVYKESALARYLSLILRQADGDKSQIDSDTMVLKSLIKDFDDSASRIPQDKGRIDILALAGLIGKQTPGELYFPSKSTFFFIPTGNSRCKVLPLQFKFVYPVYNKTSTVAGIEVVLNNVGTKKASLIENFNTDLEKSVKLRAYKEYNASMARSMAKKITAVVAGIASINASYVTFKQVSSNSIASSLALLAFDALCESTKAGLLAVDLTETPDIRQGEFFPETANAAGFTVPAGIYSGKVIYRFTDGTVFEEPFCTEVNAGKPALVVSSCIR